MTPAAAPQARLCGAKQLQRHLLRIFPCMFRPDTFALTAVLALLTALRPLCSRYVSAVVSGDRAAAECVTLDGATHAVALHGVVFGGASDLRPPVGPVGTHSGAARLACDLRHRLARLRDGPDHRDAAAARPVQALGSSGGVVLARAIVRDLYSGARGRTRTLADGRHHGARAGVRTDDRRRAAGVLRLAFALHHANSVQAGRSVVRLAQAARDLRAATPGPFSIGAIWQGYRVISPTGPSSPMSPFCP